MAQASEGFAERVLASPENHSLFANESDISSLGDLRKISTLNLQRGDRVELLDAYLFETKVVFTSRESYTQARVECVLPLRDVLDISHTCADRDGIEVCQIELAICSHPDVTETWTLFPNTRSEPVIASWSLCLRQLVSQARRIYTSIGIGLSPTVMGAFADGSNWHTQNLPFTDLSRLHLYAPLQISDGHSVGSCGAYYFDKEIIFVFKDGHGALHIHRRINLADVEAISNQSTGDTCAVGLTVVKDAGGTAYEFGWDYGPPAAGRLRFDYVFRLRTRQLVEDWLVSPPSISPVLPASVTPEPDDVPRTWYIAGIVFLVPASEANAHEYSIGVAVLPWFASDGVATYAVSLTLQRAFETLGAHRVQARILHSESDTRFAARALRKFLHLGFSYEGICRRAVLHPSTKCWTDVSVLAILDMEWTVHAHTRPPPPSLWEEMLSRQQRERERLLMFNKGLKRTKSMETVRDLRALADAAPTPSILGDDDASITASTRTHSTISTADTWDSLSELESLGGRVLGCDDRRAAGADDTADEFGSESWDDIMMDDDDDDDQ